MSDSDAPKSSRRLLVLAGLGVVCVAGYLVAWPAVESRLMESQKAKRPALPAQLREVPAGKPIMDNSGCRTAVDCEPLCEQGRAEACGKLASMYEAGIGVAPDMARSIELLERSRELGDQRGCTTLGNALVTGKGIAANPERAAQLLQPACDANVEDACEELAYLYEGGRGVPKSMSRFAALLEKACELGDLHACANAANPYRKGGGDLPKDLARAEQLPRKSCDGGLEYGCQKLAEFKAQGP